MRATCTGRERDAWEDQGDRFAWEDRTNDPRDVAGAYAELPAPWAELRAAPPVFVELVEYVGDADACALGWTVPGARLAFVKSDTAE